MAAFLPRGRLYLYISNHQTKKLQSPLLFKVNNIYIKCPYTIIYNCIINFFNELIVLKYSYEVCL